jgi:hypothetical protein
MEALVLSFRVQNQPATQHAPGKGNEIRVWVQQNTVKASGDATNQLPART